MNLEYLLHLLHFEHLQNLQKFQMPLTVFSAVLLDHYFGEPTKWHPLVGFGKVAKFLEEKFHPQQANGELEKTMPEGAEIALSAQAATSKLKGLIALILTLTPFVIASSFLQQLPYCKYFVDTIFLYLAIGASSLSEHADAVAQALRACDIPLARQKVSYIVSRDTSTLESGGIAKAAVESVLENGSDAIFAALFWFVILGAPGVVLYRLANTLDAMWGYKNERYFNFGWAAARFDDLLNYVPARLTAFTYAILGNYRFAMHSWKTQGKQWYSPNAGPVMAAGAGALTLELGGAAYYHGRRKERPILGAGAVPTAADISRATQLVSRGLMLWVALILIIGGMFCA